MHHETGDGAKGGRGIGFWMILCCLPMIAILVLIGYGIFR